jgi:type III secretion protein N (ATPase)
MTDLSTSLARLQEAATRIVPRPHFGRLMKIQGPVAQVAFHGIEQGALCMLGEDAAQGVLAEVIEVHGHLATLTPFASTRALSMGTPVRKVSGTLSFEVGDGVLGRIVDAFGAPTDNLGPLEGPTIRRPVRVAPPSPMDRPLIDEILPTGIKSIDGVLTLGKGQRVGIFGPPGTGKTSLVAGLALHSSADVIVISLVGERGREVREFIERDLPLEARHRVVIVAATSDRPAVERAICAHSATSIAEYFRDQGKSVLLIVDSLTRMARALREVGLAAGEPPARQGYPASVYPALPAVIERAGKTEKGDITALYTVLQDPDGESDPIAEEVKSLTDGHFNLSRDLASEGHYPAIDIVTSLSRCMHAIVSPDHTKIATQLRKMVSKYREIELLIQIGEYKPGGDPDADAAYRLKPQTDAFLRQRTSNGSALEATLNDMQGALR